MTLRLLADDLTGAVDTAAAFCGAGPLPVLLTPPTQAPGSAMALDLACRDGDVAAAVAATMAAAPLLVGANLAFLKIDSLLRGHWAAMLAALWRGGGFRHCVLAPAFPEQGRVTRGGHQIVRDAAGAWQTLPCTLGASLAAAGVGDIQVHDAASAADLRAIVTKGRMMTGPLLWCGTAGLAHALADQPTPPVLAPLRRPVLAVIGSHHPLTQGQVRHLSEVTGLMPRRAHGTAAEAVLLDADLQRGAAILTADIAAGTARDQAAREIAAMLRMLLPAIAPPATLIVTGGETLRALCQALAVATLEVDSAFAPGIPCGRLVGGAWDGVRFLSKSGAFGTPDLLARIFLTVVDFDKF